MNAPTRSATFTPPVAPPVAPPVNDTIRLKLTRAEARELLRIAEAGNKAGATGNPAKAFSALRALTEALAT